MADMLDRARPLGFAEWCMDDDDLLGGHYPGRQQRHALAVLSLPPSELVDPKAPRGVHVPAYRRHRYLDIEGPADRRGQGPAAIHASRSSWSLKQVAWVSIGQL